MTARLASWEVDVQNACVSLASALAELVQPLPMLRARAPGGVSGKTMREGDNFAQTACDTAARALAMDVVADVRASAVALLQRESARAAAQLEEARIEAAMQAADAEDAFRAQLAAYGAQQQRTLDKLQRSYQQLWAAQAASTVQDAAPRMSASSRRAAVLEAHEDADAWERPAPYTPSACSEAVDSPAPAWPHTTASGSEPRALTRQQWEGARKERDSRVRVPLHAEHLDGSWRRASTRSTPRPKRSLPSNGTTNSSASASGSGSSEWDVNSCYTDSSQSDRDSRSRSDNSGRSCRSAARSRHGVSPPRITQQRLWSDQGHEDQVGRLHTAWMQTGGHTLLDLAAAPDVDTSLTRVDAHPWPPLRETTSAQARQQARQQVWQPLSHDVRVVQHAHGREDAYGGDATHGPLPHEHVRALSPTRGTEPYVPAARPVIARARLGARS